MNPHVYYCSCTWSSDFSSPTARTVTRRLVHSPEGWRAWWLGKGRESGRGLGGLRKGWKVVLCRTWTWFLPPVIRECWLNTPSVVSFMTPKFNLRKSVKLTIDISTVCPSNDSGWVLNGLDDRSQQYDSHTYGVGHRVGGATNPPQRAERTDSDADTFAFLGMPRDTNLE